MSGCREGRVVRLRLLEDREGRVGSTSSLLRPRMADGSAFRPAAPSWRKGTRSASMPRLARNRPPFAWLVHIHICARRYGGGYRQNRRCFSVAGVALTISLNWCAIP
ncbi:MAG: hypothetical protein LBT22_08190 [Peptococcaceae bacterium]|nr:hypothetical protein [Peptococcaceae bacterium]